MTLQNRRHFVGMSLAAAGSALAMDAAAECTDTAGATIAAMPTYLVVYRHGPRWVAGKPTAEQQGLREHFAYYVDLYRKGQLLSGGGFTDDSGGAAVIQAADDDAAAAVVAADPAVLSEAFSYELKRWRQNPWADISKARAARGE